nr:PREDICTED: dehydrogenase/reductase SDR family member 13 [Lepisosteus oculatus]
MALPGELLPATELVLTAQRAMSAFVIAAGLVGIYFFLQQTLFKRARCKSPVRLLGKTVIITGGNTGIGKATALELARRGARVVLACRNRQKAEAAICDIRRETGNSEVVFMELDLASLQSVRSFAETFLKTEPRLDLLINNAGMMGPGRTADGFGMAFGVNHLGHFLLTSLLLERLKEGGPSRVVNVAALLHRLGDIDFGTLSTHKDLVPHQSAWQNFRAYCHSKLCNLLFTRELANRLEGTSVSCYSLHPGVVDTELARGVVPLLLPVARLFFLDAEEVGAKARDDAVARKLWEVSERLTGLA